MDYVILGLSALIVFVMSVALFLWFKVDELEKKIKLQEEEMNTFMQSISFFISEVREENERLITHLQRKQSPPSIPAFSPIPSTPSYNTLSEPTPEVSFREKVKELQKQGLNSDEIAKYLDKSKTEIELLLRFNN